jgi:hypothetical protein
LLIVVRIHKCHNLLNDAVQVVALLALVSQEQWASRLVRRVPHVRNRVRGELEECWLQRLLDVRQLKNVTQWAKLSREDISDTPVPADVFLVDISLRQHLQILECTTKPSICG